MGGRTGWFALLAATTAACASVPVRSPARPAAAPESRVGFEVLLLPVAARPADAHRERTRPVPLRDLVMPDLPPALLAAAPVEVVIVVRITVGRDGWVTQVEPSPRVPTEAGPWSALLLDSVKAATSAWAFDPARERILADGPDNDGDGVPDWRTVTESHPVAVFFDARFSFEVGTAGAHVRFDGGL